MNLNKAFKRNMNELNINTENRMKALNVKWKLNRGLADNSLGKTRFTFSNYDNNRTQNNICNTH